MNSRGVLVLVGVLFLLIFLSAGIFISNRLFSDSVLYIRLWLGGVFGIVSMMWLVIPFSFLLGFNRISHIPALVMMLIISALVFKYSKNSSDLSAKTDGNERILFIVTVSLLVVFVILLNGHILVPGKDGGLYSGQSTYGDLCLHLGIVTSIAEQGVFPPEYSIFPGTLLSYPFLVDSLSSSMVLLGTPLRWAVLIPSYVMVMLLVSGFFILANEILKHKYASAFAVLAFFLNGGFGFIYFMDGLRTNPENFTRIFDSFYTTPTNYTDHFIRWSNTICDMIIPQRTTMAGWMVILPALWLMYKAVTEHRRKYFVICGLLAGLMPMIHTHSFLAFGIICITWFFVYLFQVEDKIEYLVNWVCFGAPTAVLALPQLYFWTFRQASGEGFVRFQNGWAANTGDEWLWFWIKNVGIILILLLPALLAARKKHLSIYSGPAVLFAVASFILFQPNNYDNNKLFYIWYMFTVIIVSAYLFSIYKRMEGIRGRASFLIIIAIFCSFSGILSIGREYKSNGQYQHFDKNAVQAARFIKATTKPDSIFLSSDQFQNPVSALAGRNIISGSPIYLFFHGIDKSQRDEDVKKMFTSPADFQTLAKKYNVDYVYFSNYEKGKFNVSSDWFRENYPLVFEEGDISIFAVSERTKNQ